MHPLLRRILVSLGPALVLLAPAVPLAAQPAASLSGRVSHATSGQYLNNARLTVRGTNLVAFTDETGTYQLAPVPAGAVVLEVFYTGLEPQAVPLTLAPAAVVERDIVLAAPARSRARATPGGNRRRPTCRSPRSDRPLRLDRHGRGGSGPPLDRRRAAAA